MTTLTLSADLPSHAISRHLYGHFAEHLGRCVYEGLWVGPTSPIPNTRGFRNDVVAALKALHIPNLRWPGGCFADTYHWKDGIGPPDSRPSMVNVHWGGTTENNHCGTHEFLDLCAQLSGEQTCEPYIAGNVGSGTVQEMAEWLEYITMAGDSPMARLRRRNGREEPWPLTFWGVGNENWGCGGNMRAQYYADLYRQYASYCRHFTPGGKLYKVACGLTEDWNQILLQECHRHMDGLSVHYYTIPHTWEKKGSATDFTTDEYALTLKKAADIEGFIVRTKGQMDRFDPEKRIGIVMDEWGTWYDVEPGTNPGFLYQQNTVRDALVAGLTLNVFHRHADRVHVANIAQTVNVLQAMVLTEGSRLVLTPTYHVFEMYKVHQGAKHIPLHLTTPTYGTGPNATPQVSASASLDAAGRVNLSLCNLHHDQPADLTLDLRGRAPGTVTARTLTAPSIHALNTFDAPDTVRPTPFHDFKPTPTGLTAHLPPHSVTVLTLS